jgi:hypothetical protein
MKNAEKGGNMGTMKELVDDIIASQKERADTVSRIREEARQLTGDARALLKELGTSRKEASLQLRAELARGRKARTSEVRRMLGDAETLVAGFRSSRRGATAEMRKELAQGAAERKSGVASTLANARSQRKEAGTKLREELAQGWVERKAEVGELKGAARDLLKDLGAARQESVRELRQNLAKGEADRKTEVKEMRSNLRRAQAEVRVELSEAKMAWQELTRIRTRRVEEAAVEAVPSAEEGIPDLEAKLLAAINEHPEGITLTEVADSLGVVPVVLGRASRKLLDEGKVRKEEKLYFPVEGE